MSFLLFQLSIFKKLNVFELSRNKNGNLIFSSCKCFTLSKFSPQATVPLQISKFILFKLGVAFLFSSFVFRHEKIRVQGEAVARGVLRVSHVQEADR